MSRSLPFHVDTVDSVSNVGGADTAAVQAGGLRMQFYRTPAGERLPPGLEPLAVFNSWTTRRLISVVSALGPGGYSDKYLRWSS